MLKKKENSPGTSKDAQNRIVGHSNGHQKESWWSQCCGYLYNRESKLFCGKTCKTWCIMILYSIMYIVLLGAFTTMVLYIALLILSKTCDSQNSVKPELRAYSQYGIGLSAKPVSGKSQPLIAYNNEPGGYEKYVKSIETLLGRRKGDADLNLGPCGTQPYGYGDKPCVIVKINKQLNWTAKPLSLNSPHTSNVPRIVMDWMKLDQKKFWLVCSGYNSYDKEHIKSIQYHPYPPGFDATLYPLNIKSDSPLVAIQIDDFTFGLSLTVECSLWYEGGVSTTAFILFVVDKEIQRVDVYK